MEINLRSLGLAALLALPGINIMADEAAQRQEFKIYDDVVFFDGYRDLDKLSDEAMGMLGDADILRHRTSLYSVPVPQDVLDNMGDTFSMLVEIRALCDNYDRIGNINLAFVPKGATTYTPDEVQRIEIGRFITPFMNMNKTPNVVPYHYDMNFLSLILRDKRLRADFDIWAEFELFGIPYAANEQIKGCKDRQDVFAGTLTFITNNEPAGETDKNVLVPIVIKKPEYAGGNFNSYKEGCTDELGKCIKTWTFEVPEDCTDGQIVLVTSNHGANSGGEEYNRRIHLVAYDGETVLSYVPGRDSCEPFRKYNTQANGIYGWTSMSDEKWQSFSNWCPGDVIDNRVIKLGKVAKGEHSIRIKVLQAQFVDNQGDIPVSMYYQGVTDGELPNMSGIEEIAAVEFRSSVKVEKDCVRIQSETPVREATLYDAQGEMREMTFEAETVSLKHCAPGVHILVVQYADGLSEHHKIMVK